MTEVLPCTLTILFQGFWAHIHNDHNLWNYVYFVLYLDTVFENDRNALEKYVYEKVRSFTPQQTMKYTSWWIVHDIIASLQVKIEKLSTEFFPMRKAKVLPNDIFVGKTYNPVT